MIGVGELIEQRKSGYFVGLGQYLQIIEQGVRVAGNINNVLVRLYLAHRFIVEAGARRVDQNGAEIVLV